MTYDWQPALTKPEQPDEPLTANRLRKIIAETPQIPPDPLNGTTVLYVHPNRHKDAIRIREASGGRLHIQLSQYASPNVIAGFKGDDCVMIIRTGK